MKFKCISGVPVRHLGFEIRWKIDDGYRLKRASEDNIYIRIYCTAGYNLDRLFHTYTASDTEEFGDEGDLVRGFYFDA